MYPDISSWTEENLLEFRVILLGLDSQTIGMLNLTEDVLAEIGSVDAMLQSNTKVFIVKLLTFETPHSLSDLHIPGIRVNVKHFIPCSHYNPG